MESFRTREHEKDEWWMSGERDGCEVGVVEWLAECESVERRAERGMRKEREVCKPHLIVMCSLLPLTRTFLCLPFLALTIPGTRGVLEGHSPLKKQLEARVGEEIERAFTPASHPSHLLMLCK